MECIIRSHLAQAQCTSPSVLACEHPAVRSGTLASMVGVRAVNVYTKVPVERELSAASLYEGRLTTADVRRRVSTRLGLRPGLVLLLNEQNHEILDEVFPSNVSIVKARQNSHVFSILFSGSRPDFDKVFGRFGGGLGGVFVRLLGRFRGTCLEAFRWYVGGFLEGFYKGDSY